MKHKLLLSLFALLTTTMVWADVEINATNFPDANFRNWVLKQSYGSDGVLTEEEIAGVTTIRVSYKSIQNLTGIGYFTALTMLHCEWNQLKALDVSENTNLTALHCYHNQLKALDVSENTALTVLKCYQNQIKGEAMDALVASLPAGSNGTLDVIHIENEGNVMTNDQAAAAKAKGWIPKHYDGYGWEEYEGKDSINDIAINETTFPDENFRAWVLANAFGRDKVLTKGEIARITKLDIGSRRIQSMKGLEFFTELSWLDVYGNSDITEIDLSPFPKMKHLDVGWCKIQELDVSKNTELTYLDCRGNGLTTLDLSQNTSLTTLICFGNQLAELDLSQNTLLTEIECSNNPLEELDVSKNMNLEKLSCIENRLTTLDVSQHTALKYLTCYNNQLNSLDVTGCSAMISLQCYNNQLVELDLTGCTKLLTLYCSKNQLNELDLSTNERLDQLYCQYNNLTKLNVSNNKELWCLTCNDNQLTELDVSGVTALYHLHCYRNKLTSLDMSGNPSLINLDCYNNQIKGEAMDALLESMHTIGEGSIYGFRVINDQDEQNVITKSQVAAAKARGWKPLHHVGNNNWQEYEGRDEATGIGDAKRLNDKGQMTNDNSIYDLSGRKISAEANSSFFILHSSFKSGIYIEGGKKKVKK